MSELSRMNAYNEWLSQNMRRLAGESQRLPDLLIGVDKGASPLTSRSHDVSFRGKMIDDLTREEAIEALHQAISRIKAMEWKKP